MEITTAAPSVALLIEVREACRSGRARRLREAAGLSQAEVGALCGVTEAAVARWESGSRRPTGGRAVLYGHVLREIAQELLGTKPTAGRR